MSTASVSGRMRADRQVASGIPALNDWPTAYWRDAIASAGIAGTAKMSKSEAYATWRLLLSEQKVALPKPSWHHQ
jgi:hypothetical protein